MKKMLHHVGVSAALFASLLSLGISPAYAEEGAPSTAPVVTINGEAAPIHTETVNGKLYFSLRDYWVNVREIAPEKIKWYGDTQTVSNGYAFVFLDNQTFRSELNQTGALTDAAILKDGRVMVTASYLLDNGDTRWYMINDTENTLEFKKATWELANALKEYHPLPIPLDTETGLPAFETCHLLEGKNFSNDDFNITKEETADGKTIFTYTSRADASKTLVVTVVDGYVAHVLDNNAVYSYQPRS